MHPVARKYVLLVMVVSFIAVFSGISLYVHLSNHDHHEDHDSDDCSVCQHLLNNQNKFTLEPESGVPGTISFENYAVIPPHIYITTFYHNPFSPRAPPLV